MGKPAAKQGDKHTCPMSDPGPKPHGIAEITLGESMVLIEGKPAARVGDLVVCKNSLAPNSIKPPASKSVLIGNKPAARTGDQTVHQGILIGGAASVLIGD